VTNSNIQPWHAVVVSGAARYRLVEALLTQADIAAPAVPPLPEQFAHFRRELGTLIYGAMGVARHDTEARRRAVLRNWEFFRAPVALVVTMHEDLDHVDAVAVGMFVQTFLLAVTARGLGSCVQVSIAGYPDVLRRELDIPGDHRILCGVALGYPDPTFAANNLRIPRNPLGANITFVED
jgi:nitroreductase